MALEDYSNIIALAGSIYAILSTIGYYVNSTRLNAGIAVVKDSITEGQDIAALKLKQLQNGTLMDADFVPLGRNTLQFYDNFSAAVGTTVLTPAKASAITAATGVRLLPASTVTDGYVEMTNGQLYPKTGNALNPDRNKPLPDDQIVPKARELGLINRSWKMTEEGKRFIINDASLTQDDKDSILAQIAANEALNNEAYTITTSKGLLFIKDGEQWGGYGELFK